MIADDVADRLAVDHGQQPAAPGDKANLRGGTGAGRFGFLGERTPFDPETVLAFGAFEFRHLGALIALAVLDRAPAAGRLDSRDWQAVNLIVGQRGALRCALSAS